MWITSLEDSYVNSLIKNQIKMFMCYSGLPTTASFDDFLTAKILYDKREHNYNYTTQENIGTTMLILQAVYDETVPFFYQNSVKWSPYDGLKILPCIADTSKVRILLVSKLYDEVCDWNPLARTLTDKNVIVWSVVKTGTTVAPCGDSTSDDQITVSLKAFFNGELLSFTIKANTIGFVN